MQFRILSWAVHFYTALGGVVGLFALIAAAEGRIREAFLLLGLTMLIDGTDGLLARRVRVKEHLPHFDGAEVDNVIDFFTYIWVPVFILWRSDLLPHPLLLAIPVLAALYAYGQVDMKTEEGFFRGFPSYWNLIALYVWWLTPSPVVTSLMLILPGLLSFIPTRYLWPSRNSFRPRTTWTLTGLWALLMIYLTLSPEPPRPLIYLSFFYPAYYLLASFYVEFRARQAQD